MNKLYGIDIQKWIEHMRVNNDDSKPEGITSGSALRAFENILFPDTGLVLNRPVYSEIQKHPAIALKEIYAKLDGCNHTWKTYHGFTENYDFCQKCDEKR